MSRNAERKILNPRRRPNPRRLRVIPMQDLDWKPIPGIDGRMNARFGGAVLHVENQVRYDDGYQDQYDQPLIVESPGALVVATLEGRVGLVQNFRLVGPRPLLIRQIEGFGPTLSRSRSREAMAVAVPEMNGKAYTASLVEEGLLPEMISGLGAWNWEVPRGIAPGAGDDLEAFVTQVAKIEAEEEAGFRIRDARLVGEVNANTTFFAHSQAVVLAEIESVGERRPEERETLGGVALFGPDELRALIASGDLQDGLTLAALTIAGVL